MKKCIGGNLVAAGNLIPISKAVWASDFVFVSGQLAFDSQGAIVGEDIQSQTKTVLENLQKVLDESGCKISDVVKCTCWITDKKLFSAFNRAYADFFPKNPPARTTLVSDLVIDKALVEIELTAVKPS